MRRLTCLLLVLAALAACADPPETQPPPADAGVVDAGMPPPEDGGVEGAIVLERSNLAPAVQVGEAGDLRMRGHLRSSDVRTASTANYLMRGGFVPLTR